jgi:hypothetical protein
LIFAKLSTNVWLFAILFKLISKHKAGMQLNEKRNGLMRDIRNKER